MAYSNYGSLKSSKVYARVLPGTEAGFRGVDLTSNPSQVANYRFSALQNMWRDYHAENGGAVETIPGYRCLAKFGKRINGVFHHRTVHSADVIVVHAGNGLYAKADPTDDEDWVTLETPAEDTLADAPSRAFSYNGTLYLLDGSHYLKVDIETDSGAVTGGSVTPVSEGAYVPLAYVSGEEYEQRNMLTDAVRERAARSCADAVAPVYTDTDYSKVYRGRDTFCVPGYNADVYPTFRFDAFQAARTVVVDTDAICPSEGERVLQVGASSAATEAAAFCLRRETDVVELGDLRGMSALSALYLSTDAPKSQTGGYFGFAQQENETYFAPNVTTVHYSVTERNFEQLFVSVRDALRYLPPNVVVTRGETVKTDISFRFEDGWDTALLTVSAGVKLCAACEEREDVLQLYPEEGKLCLYCGKNIAVGRQYAYGRIREGREDMVSYLAPLRVQVMETAGECLPCTDVFDYDFEALAFTPLSEIEDVLSVKNGEYDAAFGTICDAFGNPVQIGVLCRKGDNIIDMTLRAKDYKFGTVDGYSSYADGNPAYMGTSEEAICGCTLCAIYDDHVFLSGNPNLPHTVFYSGRNDAGVTDPSYFGILNYFNDGSGGDTVRGLLATGSMLMVLKENNIWYHQGADSGNDMIPRIYPSVQGAAGIGGLGPACNFLDDPVFLSPRGVEGVSKEALTLERTVGHRSLRVDGRLTAEKALASAEFAVWDGYLCLFVGGNVYMADSRALFSDERGNAQYEWFLLSDIGDWSDTEQVYTTATGTPVIRFAEGDRAATGLYVLREKKYYEIAEDDAARFLTGDTVYESEVYRKEDEDFVEADGDANAETHVQFTVTDGKAYLVDETEEYMAGGTFTPACCPLAVGERLFFVAGKKLFTFNNDLRGVAYTHENGDVEPVRADRIHRNHYTFDGRRIVCTAITRSDNCDIPHLAKSTVKRSLVFRLKTFDGSAVRLSVWTDRESAFEELEQMTNNGENFYADSFDNMGLFTVEDNIVPVRERKKKWVEKRIMLSDGGFRQPFGIYSIAYRYKISGRIQ